MVYLSIIVPVYNKEKYLKECLDSILLKQNVDLDKFEVICIDDGSTDGSLRILEDNYLSYKNVVIIKQSNKGASSARNLGLKEVKGKYIWFVDADDKIAPNIFKKLFEILETDIDLLTFTLKDFSGDSVIDNFDENKTPLIAIEGKDIIPSEYTWGNIAKLNIIKDNDIVFNENMTYEEDILFWLKVGAYCNTLSKLNLPIYFYRKTGDSLTAKLKDDKFLQKRFLDIIEINKELVYFYKTNKIQNKYMKARIIDELLNYNLWLLKSKFLVRYYDEISKAYPLPFFIRIRYLFRYKNIKKSTTLKLVFFPKKLLKRLVKTNLTIKKIKK